MLSRCVRVLLLNRRRFYTTSANTQSSEDGVSSVAKPLHVPVMLNEILEHLVHNNSNYMTYCDLTFGAGGHTSAILRENPKSKVYALDRDPTAHKLALEMKEKYPNRVVPMLGKFTQLDNLFISNDVKENSIDAALIDCGCSSIQLETAVRGFSVVRDGPLDMRMGINNEPDSITAADVVNKLKEEDLARIIWRYGEEKYYKKIAHAINYFRSQFGDITTTKQLTEIISTVIKEPRSDSLNRTSHVGTKTFQALRIFVNNELNELFNAISILHKYIKPGGRLAVITFHSLEDRIVKSHFNTTEFDVKASSVQNSVHEKFSMNLFSATEQVKTLETYAHKAWTPVNKKVIKPSEQEIEMNTRSRSAKLRIAIKN